MTTSNQNTSTKIEVVSRGRGINKDNNDNLKLRYNKKTEIVSRVRGINHPESMINGSY